MKILQVSPWYYPRFGGIEEHVRNISERTNKEHPVTVTTADSSDVSPKQEFINGVKVIRWKPWTPFEGYRFSRQLMNYLRKNSGEFDVVHAHAYHVLPAFLAAESKSRNKLIFTPHYHGITPLSFRSILHKPYKLFGRKIFMKADRVVCVSRYERNLVLRNFDFCESKIAVIPNGINLGELKSLRKGKKRSGKTILTVARLEKYKGVQYLISVLPKLNDEIVLEVVGKGSYRPNLIELSRKLGVAKRVKFYQDLPRTELLQKYMDADLFCLLSTTEAYGISVAEALAARKCCIVANMSALAEWVDNRNCYGIDYPADLNKLKDLIETTLGKRADKLPIPDWDDVVEELIKLYSGVVERTRETNALCLVKRSVAKWKMRELGSERASCTKMP